MKEHPFVSEPKLKKELGLLPVVLSGIGIILGAGIYVLVGKAAAITGNSVWLSFLIAGIVAAFTGLSFAELSSMYPKAGAEYEYTKNAFGRRTAFMVGWLSILAGILSSATVALGFGGYFEALFGIPMIFAGVALIVLSSYIIFLGIKQSTWLAGIITLIELFGLLLIIAIGLPHIGQVDLLSFNAGIGGIFTAAALIFFAFIGFEELVRLSEETKNPSKVIPKALIISMVITSVLYILVAISAVSILGAEELGNSNSPLADVAAEVFGANAFVLLAVIALFSTGNTVLLLLLATSRIVYGIGEDKSFPHIVAKIHPTNKTPYIAIFLVMLLSIGFLFFDISFVASSTDFILFIVFILINASVIALRLKEPNTGRAFKIPLNVKNIPLTAVLGILTCILLIFSVSLEVVALSLAMAFVGVLFYIVLHKKQPSVKWPKRKV